MTGLTCGILTFLDCTKFHDPCIFLIYNLILSCHIEEPVRAKFHSVEPCSGGIRVRETRPAADVYLRCVRLALFCVFEQLLGWGEGDCFIYLLFIAAGLAYSS